MKRALTGGLIVLLVSAASWAGLASPVATAQEDWKPVPGGMAGTDPAVLVRAFPDSSAARLRLLATQIGAGDRDGALATFTWLNRHGHIFSAASRQILRDQFAIWNLAAPDLVVNAKVSATSRLYATVPAGAQLVEAVARDRRRDRLFATSVVSRQLWVRTGKGPWTTVGLPAVDSLSGLAIDHKRNLLWVASGDLGMGEGAPGAFHGLIAIDLATLKERGRIAAPVGVNPSDISIGCKGTLYASDPLGGGVYRAGPGDTALSTLIAPGTFRSPQGLTENAGCSMLYVSDYGYGLAAIVLESRRVVRVRALEGLPIPLDGIDGLWRYGRDLVAVQNGTSPRRIVRLVIGIDDTSIAHAAVLEQANPAWIEPLSGSLDGNRLLYVGNGQWDLYDKGKLLSGQAPAPTQVRILPLAKTNH